MKIRAVVVKISDRFVGDMCKTHGKQTLSCDGVPADADLVAVYYDNINRWFRCTFTHGSFDEVPDGQPYPTMKPTFTEHRQGAGG